MNNFAFLDLSMADLVLAVGTIVGITLIALIARTVYKGFIRGYQAKK